MTDPKNVGGAQCAAEEEVQRFKNELGPFVVAAENARIPMLFTNARSENNEVVYVNRSLLELTGYKMADVLGMPFHCLLARESDRVRMTPEVISNWRQSTIELSCLRQDRTVFDACVLASPVCNDVGELEQYFVSVFDLTEPVERRIQDRLREAELYRHAPGFIAFSSGRDHRFTFTNTAYETLVGRMNLVGQRVADALPELAEQGIIRLLDSVFESGERVVGAGTPIRLMRGADGGVETRYIDFIYEPVRDPSGAVVGLFCEGSDITEVQLVTEKLDEVQAQLMHVSRINAIGTMAATLAHEINQPLAAISNYATGCLRLLQQSAISPEKLQDGISAIAAASERAGKIITRLRGMTRRATPTRELFNLSAALEEAALFVRASEFENVSMSTSGSSSMLVLGDKTQIQQVIVNLLRNACYAAAQSVSKGAVVASTTQRDGQPCIVVSDNGPGFPADKMSDPFKWIESEKPDGMGIGLSICRTIMESHGGRIVLDETGPSGTAFSLTLPLARKASFPEPREAPWQER